jgi:hypothetical protein
MSENQESPIDSSGCLARLFWIALGNFGLALLLIWIVVKKQSLGCLADISYLTLLIAVIVVRYVDIRYLKGQKGTGEPANMGDFRRYAVFVSVVSLLLLGASHLIVWMR